MHNEALPGSQGWSKFQASELLNGLSSSMHQAITIEWLIWETQYVPHHMPTLNASCWWDVWLCLFNNHKAVDLLLRRQQGTSSPPKIQTIAICYWTWPPLHKIVFAQSPGTSRTKNRQHNWRPEGRVSREREKTMRICEEREQGVLFNSYQEDLNLWKDCKEHKSCV